MISHYELVLVARCQKPVFIYAGKYGLDPVTLYKYTISEAESLGWPPAAKMTWDEFVKQGTMDTPDDVPVCLPVQTDSWDWDDSENATGLKEDAPPITLYDIWLARFTKTCETLNKRRRTTRYNPATTRPVEIDFPDPWDVWCHPRNAYSRIAYMDSKCVKKFGGITEVEETVPLSQVLTYADSFLPTMMERKNWKTAKRIVFESCEIPRLSVPGPGEAAAGTRRVSARTKQHPAPQVVHNDPVWVETLRAGCAQVRKTIQEFSDVQTKIIALDASFCRDATRLGRLWSFIDIWVKDDAGDPTKKNGLARQVQHALEELLTELEPVMVNPSEVIQPSLVHERDRLRDKLSDITHTSGDEFLKAIEELALHPFAVTTDGVDLHTLLDETIADAGEALSRHDPNGESAKKFAEVLRFLADASDTTLASLTHAHTRSPVKLYLGLTAKDWAKEGGYVRKTLVESSRVVAAAGLEYGGIFGPGMAKTFHDIYKKAHLFSSTDLEEIEKNIFKKDANGAFSLASREKVEAFKRRFTPGKLGHYGVRYATFFLNTVLLYMAIESVRDGNTNTPEATAQLAQAWSQVVGYSAKEATVIIEFILSLRQGGAFEGVLRAVAGSGTKFASVMEGFGGIVTMVEGVFKATEGYLVADNVKAVFGAVKFFAGGLQLIGAYSGSPLMAFGGAAIQALAVVGEAVMGGPHEDPKAIDFVKAQIIGISQKDQRALQPVREADRVAAAHQGIYRYFDINGKAKAKFDALSKLVWDKNAEKVFPRISGGCAALEELRKAGFSRADMQVYIQFNTAGEGGDICPQFSQ